MYGPFWVMITIIIEMVVLGHLVRTLRAQIGYGISSDEEVKDIENLANYLKRFGLDQDTENANSSLKSIMKTFFLVFSFFAMVPFCAYLLFMSSLQGQPRNYETSWKRLIQIYAYSMAAFIPGIAVLVLVVPFWRAKWLCMLLTVAMATFY